MAPAIEAVGIGKRFGPVVAVEDLSFALDAGEILGVLGPNGAGKTTAVRVLTTILQPTGGTFSVAGVPASDPAGIRRRIGVLPESAGYPDRQTGDEFLRYHARLFGHSRRDARSAVDRLLEEVGLHERRRHPISTYSRGMRQRLGIARALVNAPQVVFLDEPTLGLDPSGQRQILGTIRRIARERGATVLLSTHLLGEVEETCSRVLILNRGRVVAEGTVAEVVRSAAVSRSARVRVPTEQIERALEALRHAHVGPLERLDDQPDVLVVGIDGRGNGAVNDVLRALVEASVPLLSYELEGARLSDAFLAMTEAPA